MLNSILILSSNEELKPKNILFGIVVLNFQVTVLISSLIFCYRFTANDLENSLYALLQICVFLSATYTIVVALKQRDKINELFDKIHQIQIDSEYGIRSKGAIAHFMDWFILFPGFNQGGTYNVTTSLLTDVDSSRFLDKADRRGEALTKILVFLMIAAFFFSNIFLYVFSYIWSTKRNNQIDVNQLYHLFKCV